VRSLTTAVTMYREIDMAYRVERAERKMGSLT
jgi:hypothetical protein